MPGDVVNAINAQNSEIAAGDVGGLPAPEGQMLNATVTAQSKLQTPEEFENIVLKTLSDGSTVRIKDVARVELGAESYTTITRVNGHPGAGMAISLSPGSDALKTAEMVKARMDELGADMPEGLAYAYANDSTSFIKLSVSEVQKALFEAILLVVRSEEHTSELQSLMRISYAVFCLKNKIITVNQFTLRSSELPVLLLITSY